MTKILTIPAFKTFRETAIWESYIEKKLAPHEEDISKYLRFWYQNSQEGDSCYPSQGLLSTPFDFLPVTTRALIAPDTMMKILRVRQYFLELFNHPERIEYLKKIQNQPFVPPRKVTSTVMTKVINRGLAVSIADLGVAVVGAERSRVSRKARFLHGPFVKLGRYARSLFVGAAMPDVYGSASAIATMARCLCLVNVPRNGLFTDIKRQVDLIKSVWHNLEISTILEGRSASEKRFLLNQWSHNVMGVLEGEPKKATARAKALFSAGIRTFRVYSPEPGNGPLETVKGLRTLFSSAIEIFVGQVVDVAQAQKLQAAGADGLYIGIGGGGRCTTGVRSGSVVDWPELVWRLRGEVSIPVIVEGGASDHIATTLALGASGIGVSRIVAGGTIESPGGMLYYIDQNGKFFKPYGGEASARTKFLDGKMLPFNLPSFVEGETRAAYMNFLPYGIPTIPFNVFSLTEDAVLSFVFRAVENLEELHSIDPSPIRQETSLGVGVQNTH